MHTTTQPAPASSLLGFAMDIDTALITGASRGIGLATARTLAAAGVRVVGAARTITPELKEIAELAVAVDLIDEHGCDWLVELAERELGHLDAVINCAGGGDPGDLVLSGNELTTNALWYRVLDLNLFAAVRVTRAALPGLRSRAARGIGCSVVNISSIGALEPSPVTPVPYGPAKAALNNWSAALARELGPAGIRVNTVSPGPTLTEIWTGEGSLGAALASRAGVLQGVFLDNLAVEMGIPLRRLVQPEEVASAVAFLVSAAGSGMTGANLVVDAGATTAV